MFLLEGFVSIKRNPPNDELAAVRILNRLLHVLRNKLSLLLDIYFLIIL